MMIEPACYVWRRAWLRAEVEQLEAFEARFSTEPTELVLLPRTEYITVLKFLSISKSYLAERNHVNVG
eukprot:SAG11_NODE_6753_length_1253_cov_3.454939_1_plen_67_part_10